jgi:hypothetical protein
MRGGAHEPLSRADLESKFRLNCAYGGWAPERAAQFLTFASRAFDGAIDLGSYRG